MAATLIQSALTADNQGGGLSRYVPLCSGGFQALITTESNAQRTERTGGVYSRLYWKVTANANDSTSTIRFRKNTANGNQTVSFATTETGTKQDSSNTDSVAAGDLVNFQSVTLGTGNLTIAGGSCVFLAGSNTVQHCNFNVTGTALNAATTNYFTISGDLSSLVQADQEIKIGTVGTFKNMGARVTANTIDVTGSSVLVFLKNGSAGATTITFASAETGLKEDTSNSVTVAVDDLACIRQTNTGVTGAITTTISWISLETTNNKTDYVCCARSTRTVAQTRYFQFIGRGGASSVEATPQFIIQVPCRLSNARAYVSANTWTGNFTVSIRKNTADTAITFVFATTVTGWATDASNTDTVVASDLVVWRNVTAAGSGSVTITNMVITAEMPASGGYLTLLGVG